MKKILNIFVLLALCVVYTGCDDDDNDSSNTLPNSGRFRIVSIDDLNTRAEGGTGTIVMSQENITASFDKDWATVEIVGTTVVVKTLFNDDIEGRNGTLTVSWQGGNEKDIKIPVNQAGFDLQLADKSGGVYDRFKFAGGKKEIMINSRFPFEVRMDSEWLNNYTLQGDTLLIINYPAHDVVREGEITLIVQGVHTNAEKKYKVYQNVLSYSDLIGTWDFTYTTITNQEGKPFERGEQKTIEVTLEEKENGKSYTLKSLPLMVANPAEVAACTINFHEATGNIEFMLGEKLLDVGTEEQPAGIFLCYLSPDGGYYYWGGVNWPGIMTSTNLSDISYQFKQQSDGGGIFIFRFLSETPNPDSANGWFNLLWGDFYFAKK